MFTGIIEEVGKVERMIRSKTGARIRVTASAVLEDTRLGDSISTCGVCLTVSELGKNFFEADVMNETLSRSRLGDLQPGSPVNLERALQLNARLGGHLVTGHIDGTGRIESITQDGNALWFTISAPKDILRYLIEKGSVSIDGISLTVVSADERAFRVSIIPHTAAQTTLQNMGPGDKVNLECDMMGKYAEKLLYGSDEHRAKKSRLTKSFLTENGFF